MVENQNTSGIERVTDLLTTTDTLTQPTLQQFINQVQLIIHVVLNQQAK